MASTHIAAKEHLGRMHASPSAHKRAHTKHGPGHDSRPQLRQLARAVGRRRWRALRRAKSGTPASCDRVLPRSTARLRRRPAAHTEKWPSRDARPQTPRTRIGTRVPSADADGAHCGGQTAARRPCENAGERARPLATGPTRPSTQKTNCVARRNPNTPGVRPCARSGEADTVGDHRRLHRRATGRTAWPRPHGTPHSVGERPKVKALLCGRVAHAVTRPTLSATPTSSQGHAYIPGACLYPKGILLSEGHAYIQRACFYPKGRMACIETAGIVTDRYSYGQM